MPSANGGSGTSPRQGREKRRAQRFVAENLQGTMVLASQVEVLNLSLGGVAIRADRRLNLGTEYSLKLEQQGRSVSVRGLVVWSTLSGFARNARGETVPSYTAGLKFGDLPTERLAELIGFIDRKRVAEEQRLAGIRLEIRAAEAEVDRREPYRVRLISRYGMLIEARHPLPAETQCAMALQPPGRATVELVARVVSCQAVGQDRYALGIEFREMEDGARWRLERYIESLASPA